MSNQSHSLPWAQALLVGKVLSSPRPHLHLFPPHPLKPLAEWTESTEPLAQRPSGCCNHRPYSQALGHPLGTLPLLCALASPEPRLLWDLSQASSPAPPSRKQRHGSDSEYTEKLQQYSEFVSLSSLGPRRAWRRLLLLPISAIS